jgi:hypothetical protein
MRRTGVAILVACLLGIPAGVGAFAFVYAKGFSYLDAWQKSGHRHTATFVAAENSMDGLPRTAGAGADPR